MGGFNNGLRGGRGRFGAGAMAEINIVPLVDVVLVLLIIFMITANVMEFGMEVDVPKVKTVRESAEELPVINITRSGELFLNEKSVNINDLASEIQSRFRNPKSVYVRADKATIWDPIAQVISELGAAKIDVKVVTRPEDEADKKRR
ncbi:MAG: biopolymer transporter ExbD [Acidobacteriales bacterium]|nr:biopolymer transporter ExbD [Terriglobales bacterium]